MSRNHALPRYSPDEEETIRLMWERTPRTAREIGAMHGTTKNAIIGLAWRRGWVRHVRSVAPDSTLWTRMSALERALEAVLRETRGRPSHRRAVPPPTGRPMVLEGRT